MLNTVPGQKIGAFLSMFSDKTVTLVVFKMQLLSAWQYERLNLIEKVSKIQVVGLHWTEIFTGEEFGHMTYGIGLRFWK